MPRTVAREWRGPRARRILARMAYPKALPVGLRAGACYPVHVPPGTIIGAPTPAQPPRTRYSVCALDAAGEPQALDDGSPCRPPLPAAARFFWLAIPAHAAEHDAELPRGEAPSFEGAVAAAAERFPGALYAGDREASRWHSMQDPLVQLEIALSTRGRPDLAWVTRWSDGGAEPYHAAWRASRNVQMLLLHAWRCKSGGALVARLVTAGATVTIGRGGAGVQSDCDEAGLADLIRAHEPDDLPTLADVIGRHARAVDAPEEACACGPIDFEPLGEGLDAAVRARAEFDALRDEMIAGPRRQVARCRAAFDAAAGALAGTERAAMDAALGALERLFAVIETGDLDAMERAQAEVRAMIERYSTARGGHPAA